MNPTGLMKHVGLSVLLKTLIITGSCLGPWVLLSISVRVEIYLNKLFLYMLLSLMVCKGELRDRVYLIQRYLPAANSGKRKKMPSLPS